MVCVIHVWVGKHWYDVSIGSVWRTTVISTILLSFGTTDILSSMIELGFCCLEPGWLASVTACVGYYDGFAAGIDDCAWIVSVRVCCLCSLQRSLTSA